MTSPLVSVILPVYNGAGFLPEALESIRRQDYAPMEIFVVDDGSTDETAEVVGRLGGDVHYVYQRNAGPAAARNRGIALSKGELIAFLDVDDQWPPGKLHAQVARLAADPELDIVTGRIQYITLPGAQDLHIPYEGPDNTVTHVHLGGAVFRRRVFDRVGLFDEELRCSEDLDWFMRAREEGVSMVILEQVTLLYRLHQGNMTRQKSARDLMLFSVLKRSLDRRRQKARGAPQPLRSWSEYDEARRSQPEEKNPLVSVIIPVYNGERYLAEAIESALGQTYTPTEVVVVDDGSTDGSAAIVKSFGRRARYCWQPQRGAGAARNLGVRMALGSLLAFLDSDDLWAPEKLSRQVAVLGADPQCDMVFGCVRQFYSPELAAAAGEVLSGYVPGTLLIRREAFLRAGYFDSSLRVAEFIDWYCRAREKGLTSVLLPEVVLSRRIHQANLTGRQREARADYARALKAALDRRRGAAGEGSR